MIRFRTFVHIFLAASGDCASLFKPSVAIRSLATSSIIHSKCWKLSLPTHGLHWPNFDSFRLHEECSDDCVCIGNLSNTHVKIMLKLQGGERNADVVTVLHSEKEEHVRIMMKLYGSIRTVQRQRSEPLIKSLERIKTNVKNANNKLMKKTNKKLKKDNNAGDNDLTIPMANPTVALYDESGEKIDEETDIIQGWENGRTLKICEFTYRVFCNPPKVESLKLVKMPLVGMPIYPQLQLRMATVENSRFEWYRRYLPVKDCDEMETDETECEGKTEANSGKHKMDSSDAESVDYNAGNDEDWELLSTDRTYTPSDQDVGYSVKLKIVPGSESFPVDDDKGFIVQESHATTEFGIVKGPKQLLVQERFKHTVNKCQNGSFRFVCYNILADVYAATEYAQEFLFPYCPTEALDIDYRQQLILKELAGYNADVMCLQEVDRVIFESYFMPAMSLQGFAGAFAAKDGIKEGVAVFYRREKFRLIEVDNIILRKSFKEDRNEDLRETVAQNAELLKHFLDKPSCLLVGLLESVDSKKRILFGNTHLYWHPRGCHIRLIQIELILREMRRLSAEYVTKYGNLTCIVAGDFNSNPHSGVVQMMTKGHIPANHADWYSSGKAQLISLELQNPTRFRSACGFPTYTNFVTSFQNCLDYIFIDESLEVERVVPQPSHEDVIRHTALPNETAPSDHIAQVVDLRWKT